MPLSFDNDPNLFYVAAFAFIVAVLVELWIRVHKTKKQEASTPLSDRMEKAIHYFEERKSRKKITNDTYQELTGVSDATATRDLEKLEEFGLNAEIIRMKPLKPEQYKSSKLREKQQ